MLGTVKLHSVESADLCNTPSEGQTIKVGNAGSPFKFKYSFFAPVIAFPIILPFSLAACWVTSGEDGRGQNTAGGGGYCSPKVKIPGSCCLPL